MCCAVCINDNLWVHGGVQSTRVAQLSVPQDILQAAAQRVASANNVVQGTSTRLQEKQRLCGAIVDADELDSVLVALDTDCAFRVQGHQIVVQLVDIDDRPPQPLLLLELCAGSLDDIVYEGNRLGCSLQDTLRLSLIHI